LLQRLAYPRDPGRVPLVPIIFNLDPAPHVLNFEGLQQETTTNTRVAYQFDLGLNLITTKQGIRIECNYNTDVFDASTVERWLGHFRQLLHSIVATPDAPLAQLELLDPQERTRLLELSRGPANEYPAEISLAELFRSRAAAEPEAVAVIDGKDRFTYAEVERRANQVARHLLARGLKPGEFVGLRAERAARFIWEVVGVLRSGGAYVPAATDEPAERMKMIEGTCAVLLLDPEPYEGASDAPVDLTVDAGGAAYLLYTSGSTGTPKGVVVPHRAITRLVCNTNYVRFQSDDVVAFASNLGFDAATFEIWGALLNGSSLLVTRPEHLLGPDGPAAHYQEHGVTITFVTTALFNRFARQFPTLFARMRYAVFGGEMGDASAVRAVLTQGKPEHLVNGYGPTETTTFATAFDLTEASDRVPIGRPIANTDVFILDAALQPVPIGVAGEIFIGGPGLALGYQDDAELTARRFRDTPLGRLYQTGDLARWTSDGLIDILGRADRQIKLRGFRIEPGEIETHLQEFPHVRQAAVVAYRDPHGDLALAGYLVPKNGRQPSVEEVRHFLRGRVPQALIPASLSWLPQLPLTANGKLDAAALPAPTARAEEGREVTPPGNPVQAQLVEIWEEVLDRRPIGIHDDFFELGGHSLLAAQVISRIAERMGGRLNFGEFFDHPTIEKHALRLGSAPAPAPARDTPCTTIHPDGQKTPVFFYHGDVLGGGMFCQTLAREIGSDHPFHVLHAHGLHGEEIPPTVEAMAAERLHWIRQIQPHGPYILGGYCNGALLAHQTARLLREAGEPVKVVLMLFADGSNIRFRSLRRLTTISSVLRGEDEAAQRRRFLKFRDRISNYETFRHYYAAAAKDLIKQPPGVQASRLWRKTCRILRRFVPKSLRSPDASLPRSPTARHKEEIINIYDDICRAYIPGPSDTRAVLLWPQDEPAESLRGSAGGWERICTQLEVVKVPGDHTTSVAQNANVVVIGAAMQKIIQDTEDARLPRAAVRDLAIRLLSVAAIVHCL
jgi:amino acid adenylation domain-containing protein